MKSKKRITALVWVAFYIALYLGVSFLVQRLYLVRMLNIFQSRKEIVDKALGDAFALSVISSIITLWVYILIGKLRKKPFYSVVKNKKVTAATVFMGIVCAIGARFVVSAYFYFSDGISVLRKSYESAAELSPTIQSGGQMLAAIIATMVVAPIFEEIFFRCIIMGELMGIMRPWAAITLQALIFGAIHGVLFQSVFATLAGVLLGIIYYRTKSLKTCAVCHFVFNMTTGITELAVDIKSAFILMIFGIMLCAISIFYIVKEGGR